MSHQKLLLMSATMKVLLPSVAILIVVIRAHRTSDWRATLGLLRPPWAMSAVFVSVYTAWMLLTNALMHWRGPWDFTVWRNASFGHDAARVLAVGILGPIAEELIFRGAIFTLLAKTRVATFGAILITALLWGSLHIQYDWHVIVLVCIDGFFLGAARAYTRSVWAPIVMHMVWNLYAVW